MVDKFPGPYRSSIPQSLDDPDPMISRVPFSKTDVGARKSVINKAAETKNPFNIEHVPNANSK